MLPELIRRSSICWWPATPAAANPSRRSMFCPQNLSPHSEISEQRAIGLWRLATREIPITIAPGPVSAAADRDRAITIANSRLTLRVRGGMPLEDVIAHLRSIGYEKREPVEMVGEYSVRGGILDVFPAESSKPVRIEFFGDLDRVHPPLRCGIAALGLADQRGRSAAAARISKVARAIPRAVGVRPVITSQYQEKSSRVGSIGYRSRDPRSGSILSLAQRFGDRLGRVGTDRKRRRAPVETAPLTRGSRVPIPPEKGFFTWEELRDSVSARTASILRELDVVHRPLAQPLHISTRPSMTFHGNIQVAVSESRSIVENGGRVVFFAPSNGELERLVGHPLGIQGPVPARS